MLAPRAPDARQELVRALGGHRVEKIFRGEIGVAAQDLKQAKRLGDRHPIRAVERQLLDLLAPLAHGRRPPGMATTLAATGCAVLSSPRRPTASL